MGLLTRIPNITIEISDEFRDEPYIYRVLDVDGSELDEADMYGLCALLLEAIALRKTREHADSLVKELMQGDISSSAIAPIGIFNEMVTRPVVEQVVQHRACRDRQMRLEGVKLNFQLSDWASSGKFTNNKKGEKTK